MSTLNKVPTILFRELDKTEQDRYMEFFVENDVKFSQDEQGDYIAVIRVLNPKRTFQSVTPKKRQAKQLINACRPTFSSKQKRTSSPEKPRKTPEKRVQSARKRDKIDTSQFQKFLDIVGVSELYQLRPKLLKMHDMIKIVEEIYNYKYNRDVGRIEVDQQAPKTFCECIAEFYTQKYKNRRVIEQNAIDICYTLQNHANLPEIELFQGFILEKFGEDSLSFFIYLRHIVETELSILLHPKYNGMKLQNSTRNTFINLRQASMAIGTVFKDEINLANQFIGVVNNEIAQQEEPVINLGKFFLICVQNYENVPMLEESLELSVVEKSFDKIKSQMDSETRDSIDTQMRNIFEDSANTSMRSIDARQKMREFKERCIEFSNVVLLQRLISVISSNFDSPEAVQSSISDYLKAVVQQLIESAFDGDKRRWLETLNTTTDDKESLKYVEQVQKKIREVSQEFIEDRQVSDVCTMILKTPLLKDLIVKIGEYAQL